MAIKKDVKVEVSERTKLLSEIDTLRKTADFFKVKYPVAEHLTKKTNKELDEYITKVKNNLVNKLIRDAEKGKNNASKEVEKVATKPTLNGKNNPKIAEKKVLKKK